MTTPNRPTALLLGALLLAACGDARPEPGDAHGHEGAQHEAAAHHEATAHHHTPLAAGEITSGSIYNLTGEWWDAAGEPAPLSRLGGRAQVVAMVYTNCAQACPAILAEMKRIEASIDHDAYDVGFVLASMDPERDSPEQLAEFARRAGLDERRWTLLGADDGDVLELAAVLGVQNRRLPDGEFAHSNILTVLDVNGEIVHRQLGLGQDAAATTNAALRAAGRSEDA